MCGLVNMFLRINENSKQATSKKRDINSASQGFEQPDSFSLSFAGDEKNEKKRKRAHRKGRDHGARKKRVLWSQGHGSLKNEKHHEKQMEFWWASMEIVKRASTGEDC